MPFVLNVTDCGPGIGGGLMGWLRVVGGCASVRAGMVSERLRLCWEFWA